MLSAWQMVGDGWIYRRNTIDALNPPTTTRASLIIGNWPRLSSIAPIPRDCNCSSSNYVVVLVQKVIAKIDLDCGRCGLSGKSSSPHPPARAPTRPPRLAEPPASFFPPKSIELCKTQTQLQKPHPPVPIPHPGWFYMEH